MGGVFVWAEVWEAGDFVGLWDVTDEGVERGVGALEGAVEDVREEVGAGDRGDV